MTDYARYRHLVFEPSDTPTTEAGIAAVEVALGAKLPEAFKAFVRVAGGADLTDYVIDVPTGDGRTEALGFCEVFSAGDGPEQGSLVSEIALARENQFTPPGVLPFARDGGGSMVYLDLTPEGAGRVTAFVEGLPAWTGLRTESAFIPLAASFDAYIDRLRVDRDSVVQTITEYVTGADQLAENERWLDAALPGWRDDAEMRDAVETTRARLT